jgi:hypothetical protein
LADTFKAGTKSSMDVAILTEAKDVWFDKIIEVLDGLVIPDVED